MGTAKIRTSELRALHHMTQAMLAQEAKLSKTTISNLESGHQTKIALNTISKLCRVFNCSPTELFDLQDDKEEKTIKLQRKALKHFIGSLKYKKSLNVDELDSDLALITDKSKRRGKR